MTAPQLVQDNVVVTLTFSMSTTDGETIEQADSSDPLVYLHGHDQLLPGFERRLGGLKVGARTEFTIPADEGFGGGEGTDIQTVERDALPEGLEPEVGMQLLADFGAGVEEVTIVEVTDEYIKLDLRHPFAGHDLVCAVEILEVREATAEEIEHGHAHGPHGHHHH